MSSGPSVESPESPLFLKGPEHTLRSIPLFQSDMGRLCQRLSVEPNRSAGRNMVSIMDEALELEVGHKVLEIGSGSGWHASTVAEIVAPTDTPKNEWGHVYTVEIVRELAEFARENVEKAGYGDRVTVICGDGSEGYPDEAPYDRVLVTAAAPDVPRPLVEQLKSGSVLVIPVGGIYLFQTLVRVRKMDGRIVRENLGGVAFVPLVGKHGYKV